MFSKPAFAKKDVLAAIVCCVFLLTGLGTIGSAGRRRAREAVCASNLTRWGRVFFALADDNLARFLDRSDMIVWVDTMWSYYSDEPRLLLCPEATKTWEEGGRNPHMAWGFSVEPGGLKGSYGINLWISDQAGSASVGGCRGTYWRTPYRVGASGCPVLIDSQAGNIQPYPCDLPPVLEQDIWTPGPTNEIRRACVNRHNGVNAVFLDGSVRKVGLKHLWRTRWYPEWDMSYPTPGERGNYAWNEGWMANFKEP
jgi:prepilin-type processing-associated H-X9-DG protein